LAVNPTDLHFLLFVVLLEPYGIYYEALLHNDTEFDQVFVQGVGVCIDNKKDRRDIGTEPVDDLPEDVPDDIP